MSNYVAMSQEAENAILERIEAGRARREAERRFRDSETNLTRLMNTLLIDEETTHFEWNDDDEPITMSEAEELGEEEE